MIQYIVEKIPYMLSNSIFGKLVEYQMIVLKFFLFLFLDRAT